MWACRCSRVVIESMSYGIRAHCYGLKGEASMYRQLKRVFHGDAIQHCGRNVHHRPALVAEVGRPARPQDLERLPCVRAPSVGDIDVWDFLASGAPY